MKRLLWILPVMFLAFGQSVYADHACDKMKNMVEELNLTDDQKAQITPSMNEFKLKMHENWTQMKDLRMQFNQQVQSDKMDQATVDGLIDKKVKMMSDMMKAKMALKHQIWMILTPEQKTSYQEMVKKWENKMTEKLEDCQDDD